MIALIERGRGQSYRAAPVSADIRRVPIPKATAASPAEKARGEIGVGDVVWGLVALAFVAYGTGVGEDDTRSLRAAAVPIAPVTEYSLGPVPEVRAEELMGNRPLGYREGEVHQSGVIYWNQHGLPRQ